MIHDRAYIIHCVSSLSLLLLSVLKNKSFLFPSSPLHITPLVRRDISVHIATGLQLWQAMKQTTISRQDRGDIFLSYPNPSNCHRDPSSLLFSGCRRSFTPQLKRSVREFEHLLQVPKDAFTEYMWITLPLITAFLKHN